MTIIKSLLQRYKNMSPPIKASLWYAVCNIFQKGISFIVVPVYVRLLTTSEYGRYTVFQSWRDIIIIFATLYLYGGVFTKAMVDYNKERDRFTSSMQGLSTTLTIGLYLLYLPFSGHFNALLDMDTLTVTFMFAYYLFSPSFLFWSTRQRVDYKFRAMIAVTLGSSVMVPVLSICLLLFTDLREKAVIWAFLLIQAALGLVFYVFSFIKDRTFFDRDYWAYALKFNVPLIPHYLSIMILGQADRIMIKELCGEAKAAIYSLAYSISQLMTIITGAINNTLTPWVYEHLKKKEYAALSKRTFELCVLVGAMTMGVILICPEVVMIMGTSEYMEAIWVIPTVSLSVFVIFCYNLYSCVEFYYNSTVSVMIASVISALLNIVLNAIFIPAFGFAAAGYTTLACYSVLLLVHFLCARSVLKNKLGITSVYSDKKIAVLCVVFFVMMCLCLLLYSNTALRYISILVLAAATVIKRNEIIKLIW